MSLLLDALKRAEDAKRAKAEAAAGTSQPIADGNSPPAAESAPPHASPVAASATPPPAPAPVSAVAPAEIASDSPEPGPWFPLLSLEVVESRGVDPVSLSGLTPESARTPSPSDGADGGTPPMAMEALLASKLGVAVAKQARQLPGQSSAATAAFRAARTASVPAGLVLPAADMPALALYAIESDLRAGTAGPHVTAAASTNPALDSSNREAIKNAFAVKQSVKPGIGSKAKWALPLIGVLLAGLGAGGWYVWNEMNRFARPGVARSPAPTPAALVALTPAPAALPQAAPQAAPAQPAPVQAGAANQQALTTAAAKTAATGPALEVDAPLPPLLPPPATQVREARAPKIAKIEPMTPREAIARRIEALPASGADATTRVKLALAKPTSAPQISPALSAGYAALAAGDYALAKRRYAEAISANANSADAHLGFATAAARDGESADFALAIRHYQRVLEIDPRNSTASAALIVLGGGPGVASSGAPRSVAAQEAALRMLVSQDPSAANAHFLLGNLFAENRRWREAQQAFFEAARLQPQNADYSYNLAVSLDHLGQGAAAADFYKRARAATSKGQFDTAAVDRRIAALSSKPNATNSGGTGSR